MSKCAVFLFVLFVLSVQNVFAGPKNRVKRISDSHWMDRIYRIYIMNQDTAAAFTMPVGLGQYDQKKIGRRRRSQARILDVLFNQSEEDPGDPIEINDYDFDQRLRDLK